MKTWHHLIASKDRQEHGLAIERQLNPNLNVGMLTLSFVLSMMQCLPCRSTALPEVTGDLGDAAKTGYGRKTGKLH